MRLKMPKAIDIIKNPNVVAMFKEKQVVLTDMAVTGFGRLEKAIAIMNEQGWRCVNLSTHHMRDTIFMTAVAVMEKN